jgi:hypothetical protein
VRKTQLLKLFLIPMNNNLKSILEEEKLLAISQNLISHYKQVKYLKEVL